MLFGYLLSQTPCHFSPGCFCSESTDFTYGMRRTTIRWRRQRLSALVASRLFGFVGRLGQSGSCVNSALRLS